MNRSLCLLAMLIGPSALLAVASEKPAAKVDPLVGHWRCSHEVLVRIYADGTADATSDGHGTWKAIPTATAERKYQISWRNGLVIDTVTLDRSGKKYATRNNEGFKYTAERVEE